MALDNAGVVYTEVDGGAVSAASLERSIIFAYFSEEPTDFAPHASTVLSAVESGSWIMLGAFGLRLLDYSGFATVTEVLWFPAVVDSYFFVTAQDDSPLYDGLPEWRGR